MATRAVVLLLLATVAVAVFLFVRARRAPSETSGPGSSGKTPVTEWDALTEQAAALYQQGDYAGAEARAQQALALAEKALGPNDLSLGRYLNNLALMHKVQGQYAKGRAAVSAGAGTG